MIQLVALRSFTGKDGKLVTHDKLIDIDHEIPSLDVLLKTLPEVLEKIPADKRWNIFYTVAHCTEDKRVFESTEIIPFDLDGIEKRHIESYASVLCEALGLDRTKVGLVSSGNGLHVLVKLKHKITDKDFFKKNRAHYKACCHLVEKALEKAGLPCKEVDAAVFDPRRILRLPGTTNRKVGKPDSQCELLQEISGSQELNLADLSGVPIVKREDEIGAVFKKYPNTDPPAVLQGCEFLKHCHANADKIAEPEWYAALSVVARLDGKGSTGRERAHELSRGYRGYSSDETDQKIEQALEASGPRTCQAIHNLWGGCAKCPHWQKINSPILIHGDGHIRTEGSGFHDVFVDGKGKTKYIPCHEDLVSYFKRERGFKILADSRHCYVWDKTHYVEIKSASLEAFAREKFDPKPTMETVKEFRQRVEIANIVPVSWWEDSLKRKMNFLNGYLDIDTMDFRPHDPEIAFRGVLPYAYDEDAKAPVFDKMMALVTGGDKETQAVLEEFMGYCLSNDDCWAQKALVLTGEGSNGKSTFLDALSAIAGDENFSTVNLSKVDEHYNLAMLDKKLFNISEETSPKALTDNQTFKNLVTGGKIIVRLPRESPYQISNSAKLVLTCNELPASSDNTHGFYRRLLIVPFSQVIEKGMSVYDPHLSRKIRGELPGVLNRALAGYQRLVANKGFTDSVKVKETLEEYRLENDSVLYWVKEHMVVHTNGGFEQHFTPMADLYAAYRDTMKAMTRSPVHEQKFCKQIAKLRGDIWGDHPYQERAMRKTLLVQGRSVKVRGLQGVAIEPLN